MAIHQTLTQSVRGRVVKGAAALLLLAGCSHAGSTVPGPPMPQRATQLSGWAAQQRPPVQQQTVQLRQMTDVYFADGAPNLRWAEMAPWLDWATATGVQSLVLHALGVKTKLYTDPNRQGPGDPMYTNDESTFAHDCSGRRITIDKMHKYLMDPHSKNLVILWSRFIESVSGQFDAVSEDSADHIQGVTSALPCRFNQNDWTAATNAMDTAVGETIVYNGLGNLSDDHGAWGDSPAIGLNSTAIGGVMEGCYSSVGSDAKPHDKVWVAMENTELHMSNDKRMFVCDAMNLSSASGVIDQRMYLEASFLLTYDAARDVISPRYATPSGFPVLPEVQMVPTSPLVVQPWDVNALQLPGGIYGREYATCYLAGVPVGRCAMVVNSSHTTSMPFPWPSKYHHTLTVHGSGVLDGGTVSAAGPAPPVTVGPETGVIAVQ